MSAAIKQIVTVRSGGVVEVRSPELREGDQVEVTVVVMRAPDGAGDAASAGGWRRYAGAVSSGDPQAGNNSRVDVDLANEYNN
jgi:hypothetical protein